MRGGWGLLELSGRWQLRFGSVSRLRLPGKYLMCLPDVKRREHTPVAKHRAARIKTPGAFLNNAKRWPGYGCTSGMRCVIARVEPARDGVFAALRLCGFAEGVCSLKPAQR